MMAAEGEKENASDNPTTSPTATVKGADRQLAQMFADGTKAISIHKCECPDVVFLLLHMSEQELLCKAMLAESLTTTLGDYASPVMLEQAGLAAYVALEVCCCPAELTLPLLLICLAIKPHVMAHAC